MRSFQPMYMTPSRIALPYGFPNWSGPSSHARKVSALARCCASRAVVIQSSARPSLCSLWPPTSQARGIQTVWSAPYVALMRSDSRCVPGLAAGSHCAWPSYVGDTS